VVVERGVTHPNLTKTASEGDIVSVLKNTALVIIMDVSDRDNNTLVIDPWRGGKPSIYTVKREWSTVLPNDLIGNAKETQGQMFLAVLYPTAFQYIRKNTTWIQTREL
jgi:hypothetical protein